MIETWFKTTKSTKSSKVRSFRAGSWINVFNATVEDLKKVADLTSLTYEDLDDILDPYEIPRIERQDDALIIFLRNPSENREGLHTETLNIVLTNDFLVTISPGKNDVVQSMLKKSNMLPTTQRAKLVISLFKEIANSFTVNIKKIRNSVLEQKGDIHNIKNNDILRLTENEEILNQYLSSLTQISKVFNIISSGKYINMYQNDTSLLEDVSITIEQSVDVCKVNLRSINNLRESYQIIFTNKLNKTIQFLTSITIIMTVPTIISSIYGMNVDLPFGNHPLAFWLLAFISFIICFVFFYVFSKKRWF